MIDKERMTRPTKTHGKISYETWAQVVEVCKDDPGMFQRLLRAALDYDMYGDAPTYSMSPAERILWAMIQKDIDAYLAAWDRKAEQARTAGRRGGYSKSERAMTGATEEKQRVDRWWNSLTIEEKLTERAVGSPNYCEHRDTLTSRQKRKETEWLNREEERLLAELEREPLDPEEWQRGYEKALKEGERIEEEYERELAEEGIVVDDIKVPF